MATPPDKALTMDQRRVRRLFEESDRLYVGWSELKDHVTTDADFEKLVVATKTRGPSITKDLNSLTESEKFRAHLATPKAAYGHFATSWSERREDVRRSWPLLEEYNRLLGAVKTAINEMVFVTPRPKPVVEQPEVTTPTKADVEFFARLVELNESLVKKFQEFVSAPGLQQEVSELVQEVTELRGKEVSAAAQSEFRSTTLTWTTFKSSYQRPTMDRRRTLELLLAYERATMQASRSIAGRAR